MNFFRSIDRPRGVKAAQFLFQGVGIAGFFGALVAMQWWLWACGVGVMGFGWFLFYKLLQGRN